MNSIDEISSFLSGDLKAPESGSAVLKKSLSNPSNHQHYIKLASWLIESYIFPTMKNKTSLTRSDVNSWLKEVQSLLEELGIPFSINGSLSPSVKTSLLEWIIEEIQCMRLSSFASEMEVGGQSEESREDNTRALLKTSCKSLNLSSPPSSISPKTFLEKLGSSLTAQTSTPHPPIISQMLSQPQWDSLQGILVDLNAEYSTRWVMLLARLDATIQSFTWSNRLEDKKKLLVEETYGGLKRGLPSRPSVSLGDLLASSLASLRFERLSSGKSSSNFAKVRMGKVPDRGGRPRETPAPPPEVPSWQQNNNGRGRGRGQQRGHQDHRGGFQQGGNHRGGQGQYNQGRNFNQSQQGYHNQGQQGHYNQSQQGHYNQGQQSHYNQGQQGHYSQGQQASYSQGYNNQGHDSQGQQGGHYGQGHYNQGHGGGDQSGRGHYGGRGGGYHRGGRGDHGDPHGKKRRVQDNRF